MLETYKSDHKPFISVCANWISMKPFLIYLFSHQIWSKWVGIKCLLSQGNKEMLEYET